MYRREQTANFHLSWLDLAVPRADANLRYGARIRARSSTAKHGLPHPSRASSHQAICLPQSHPVAKASLCDWPSFDSTSPLSLHGSCHAHPQNRCAKMIGDRFRGLNLNNRLKPPIEPNHLGRRTAPSTTRDRQQSDAPEHDQRHAARLGHRSSIKLQASELK